MPSVLTGTRNCLQPFTRPTVQYPKPGGSPKLTAAIFILVEDSIWGLQVQMCSTCTCRLGNL